MYVSLSGLSGEQHGWKIREGVVNTRRCADLLSAGAGAWQIRNARPVSQMIHHHVI